VVGRFVRRLGRRAGVDEPVERSDPIPAGRVIEQLARVHQVIDAFIHGFNRFPSEDQRRALVTAFDRRNPAVSIRVMAATELVVRASPASILSLVQRSGSTFLDPDWLV
jgi:hypothetical protein